MKLSRKLYPLLAAAFLAQLLVGCQSEIPEATPSEAASPSPTATQPPKVDRPSPSLSPSPSPTATQEPSAEPTLEPNRWEPEHTLGIRFTPAKGLELPVAGATGYASVKLPLWGQQPVGQEGKLATIYAPPPVEQTVPQQADAAADPVEETDDPLPTESAGGDPAPPVATGEPSVEPPTAEPTPDVTPTPGPTPEPSPEPTVELTPEPTLEPTPALTPAPDPMEGAALVLEPGTAFVILRESGDWWQVRAHGVTGWIEHRYCLINLPDVIPSMIYNDTNAYSSVFVSCGKNIPGITGQALYHAKAQNPRLGHREFMMPVLYAMAKNVCQAQQNALAEGNTLVLYEGFRPYSAQTAVVRGLSKLAQRDREVKAGISTRPWDISWFIATGASNHQQGYAMDVSLAKVTRAHMGSVGGHSVVLVDEYEEYDMPTPIHELSMASATYTRPVNIFSNTAWKSAELAPAMAANAPAKALQRYCTMAKLTPLASEWWHFNDLTAHSQIRAHPSSGNYLIKECLSTAP